MLEYQLDIETIRVVPRLAKYQLRDTRGEDRISLSLVDAGDGSPVLTATVNLPQYPLPENCVFIKDWAENAGVLDWLIAKGMASLIGGIRENIPYGRVMATMVVLDIGAIEEFAR